MSFLSMHVAQLISDVGLPFTSHRHMTRVFPNRSLYRKDPPRFALVKDGTSTFSSESVFLLFSRQSLVSGKCSVLVRGRHCFLLNIAWKSLLNSGTYAHGED